MRAQLIHLPPPPPQLLPFPLIHSSPAYPRVAFDFARIRRDRIIRSPPADRIRRMYKESNNFPWPFDFASLSLTLTSARARAPFLKGGKSEFGIWGDAGGARALGSLYGLSRADLCSAVHTNIYIYIHTGAREKFQAGIRHCKSTPARGVVSSERTTDVDDDPTTLRVPKIFMGYGSGLGYF